MKYIKIQGARTHNLKNINLTLPRNKLIVITGLSGSGKSSLAFDTLYAEGQRRYVESLSAYARQFLSMMEKPDVDHIEGLSPAISIEQKSTSHNPRSTVGTVTEIYDYLRLLYARVGEPYCPVHKISLNAQTVSQITDQILKWPHNSKFMLLAPVIRRKKGEHLQIFKDLKSQGFIRARIDGIITDLAYPPQLDKNQQHTIEVVVDRFKIRDDISLRITDSIETALELSHGLVILSHMENDEKKDVIFSSKFSCVECGYSIDELEPRIFSFNNPAGACVSCDGLGIKEIFNLDLIVEHPDLTLAEGAIRGWNRRNFYYFNLLSSLAKHYGFSVDDRFDALSDENKAILFYGSKGEEIEFYYSNDQGVAYKKKHAFEGIIPNFERRYRDTESQSIRDELAKYLSIKTCQACDGTRLKESSRSIYINTKTLPDVVKLPVDEAHQYVSQLKLTGSRGKIAAKVLKEIQDRLSFLINVGLNYLSLDRSADTLSGGEAQRIRLASQIGVGLVGVMYILDEPSIGLHQRDNERLLKTLLDLKKLGNTVLVVEHDEEAIRAADYVVDIGPGAGVHGGEIVAEGSPDQIMENPSSLTGQFLSGKKEIDIPKKRVSVNSEKRLKLSGCSGNNLRNVTLVLPIGLMTCITGVSGSGKSTLINRTLYPVSAKILNRAFTMMHDDYKEISGLEHLDKCIDIDQSPIGRTPRSNSATYTGIFTAIRELFAGTQEARSRGYKIGRFSFNVKGGRCDACQGDGVIKVAMHFLPDIYVTCDICNGKRYNRETLDIYYKGKSIDQVLDMTIEQALVFFKAIPAIARKLSTLIDVGLSYITLGQNATTLSGGEAQRVKLAKELSKIETGKTLYILDEPTTGLHFQDIKQLLIVLRHLRDAGNTIVVIEHNLDVIKTADWIVDLGPEGGSGGGEIMAEGTPEEVANNKLSHTGRFLKPILC